MITLLLIILLVCCYIYTVWEKRSLLKMVMKGKMQYFEHLARAGGMQRLLIDGKVE